MPRSELVVAVVERDPAAVHLAHHTGDVLDVERHAQARVAHVAPGRVRHLAVLQVETGAREDLEVADVVVVHVGDDDVVDLRGVDVERGQTLARVADDRAVASRPGCLAEAGVDDERPFGRFRHP